MVIGSPTQICRRGTRGSHHEVVEPREPLRWQRQSGGGRCTVPPVVWTKGWWCIPPLQRLEGIGPSFCFVTMNVGSYALL
jgi:hypothetical protein